MFKKGILVAGVLILSAGMAFATINAANFNDSKAEADIMITGTITDEETDAPVPFAKIKVNDLGTATVTNENGRFNYSGLEPGSYTLKIDADGYETYETQVEVSEEGAIVHIEMNPIE